MAVRNAKLIDELTFVRKYLEELLENANALILVVNRDRKVVVFNHALVTLTGREKAEVLGSDVEALVPRVRAAQGAARSSAAALARRAGHQLRDDASAAHDGREIRVAFNTSTVHAARPARWRASSPSART